MTPRRILFNLSCTESNCSVVRVGLLLLGQRLIAHRFTTRETDYFFAQRVLCYWNKLPADVKCSESVTSFKSRIDSFWLKGYKENRLGHFWELSYDIYDKVEVNLRDRMMYTSFMKKNPLIARRKTINLIGFI